MRVARRKLQRHTGGGFLSAATRRDITRICSARAAAQEISTAIEAIGIKAAAQKSPERKLSNSTWL